MFHYLFTNDLRISNLETFLIDAGKCFRDDCVPSAAENKNMNNNMNTLGFYFNLTKESNCTKECANGNVRKVVLNFIKKFQFPNPRTDVSLRDCINDGIHLAPLRVIMQVLYIMKMMYPSEAFLTKREIAEYIFFNEEVAKTTSPDIISLVKNIIDNRTPNAETNIPSDTILEAQGRYWKHCKRQLREMVKILLWSGCVAEDDNGFIKIQHERLTRDNEADLFEIITYSGFWDPGDNENPEATKHSYQSYMDIESIDSTKEVNPTKLLERVMPLENKQFIFACLDLMKEHNLFNVSTIGVLQSKEDCAAMFKHNSAHGILYKVDTAKSEQEQDNQRLGADGRRRYYEDKYEIEEDRYFVSSEWRPVTADENPREPLVDWIISLMSKIKYHTGYTSNIPRNRILFGAPGTGKSNTLNRNVATLLQDGGEYERVTFHPDYSYANFVGTYKPVPTEDGISYEFVPGPFIRLYVKALQNSKTLDIKPYVLIVEEINRANVAAVFGDIFQLLDRDSDEKSEYPIHASEDLKNYLSKADVLGGNPEDYQEICIPDNMFIWATMNSADQGVYPMDTAFKRRWDFTYLGINNGVSEIADYNFRLANGKVINWNTLRTAINDRMAALKINEDKLMGPFFLSKKILGSGNAGFLNAFKNKVLMYIFEDAGKQKKHDIFRKDSTSGRDLMLYSALCEKFDKNGIEIFCDEITKSVPYIEVETSEAENE